MQKKYIFSVLMTLIVTLGLLHMSTSHSKIEDSTINQLGAAVIYKGLQSESDSDKAVGVAGGGILIGTGMALIEAGVPASVTPLGWACIAGGCIL